MTSSVPHEQLSHLSFPDAQVESTDLDLQALPMALRLDRAWLNSEPVRSVEAGALVITGWARLEVRAYEHKTGEWSKIEFTPLRDICEFVVDASAIVLRGFAKDSGQWIEVVAAGEQVQATTLHRLRQPHQEAKSEHSLLSNGRKTPEAAERGAARPNGQAHRLTPAPMAGRGYIAGRTRISGGRSLSRPYGCY